MIFAVVGPESSGKTTLAERLAARFDAPWLPEFAREYLRAGEAYSEVDLERIARGQLAAEQALVETDPRLAFLDTDLVVIHVWWQEKYGRVPSWVRQALAAQAPREYLLVRPDLPWQPDPLRESPHDRERLLAVYRETLGGLGFVYSEIGGAGDERFRLAEAAVARSLTRGER